MNEGLLDIVRSVKSFIELEMESGIGEYLGAGPAKGTKALSGKESRVSALDDLEAEVLSCRRCGLGRGRTNAVFGTGNPQANIMFIGEAPGYEEDLQGLPFVGRAGELLTKIIEAMALKRRDVYITNVVKCRPPQNRNPLPTEILACDSYLARQIQIVKPRLICALGKHSAQSLLKTDVPISRMRGNFYDHKGITVMPTFHPAYLLRNPADKKLVWQDMKRIMQFLNEARTYKTGKSEQA